jgi:type IV pilus assembly protein PilA
MTDWYYHAPGQGRVGPLSVEQMRQCYRERRINRETLAWHDGLREWQPVERMIEELGLSGVQPDASLPPPMPPRPPAATASHAGPMRASVAPPPSNRSGCVIAIVVLGIVGLIVLAILAAIAVPAYQDYVKRSQAGQSGHPGPQPEQPSQPAQLPQKVYTFDAERMAKTDALARELVTVAMREFYAANGNTCPDTYEFDRIMVRYPRYQGSEDDGWFGIDPAHPEGAQCAYEVRYSGLGPEVQDKTLRYEVNIAGDDVKIVCRNRTLPDSHLPPHCHVI